MEPEKHLFGLFGLLSVRVVRGARRRPVDRLVKPEDEIIRKRQRDRARIMALLLGAFVVLHVLHHHRQDGNELVTRIAQNERQDRAASWR